MPSKSLLVGNWKMNLGLAASAELARNLAKLAAQLSKTEIWVAPSSICIPNVSITNTSRAIKVGAQNVCSEPKGAFTGEISLAMLQEVGCEFTLVGHSERRKLFGETIESANLRALFALSSKFQVIFCVGETLEEREAGKTEAVLTNQLGKMSEIYCDSLSAQLIIAYEPVWAIGTGRAASVEQISAAHSFIHNLFSKATSAPPRILYGGSVSPENFPEIIALREVAGALIGNASLSIESMQALATICESKVS